MRAKISVFCVLSALSGGAWANAALPVVNVSAGTVSARAMFGEAAPVIAAQSAAPAQKVVARSAVKSTPSNTASAAHSMTSGADILMPLRPANNIWARGEGRPAPANVSSEAALRMPQPAEFALVDNGYALPEESLDSFASARVATRMPAPVDTAALPANTEILDAEITKLVELQRKADASVSRPAPATIASRQMPKDTSAPAAERSAEVITRRQIVPMDDYFAPRAAVQEIAQGPIARAQPVADADEDFAKLSPSQLKKAFKKTYVSDNKHLSTYQIDDRFDVASDVSYSSDIGGLESARGFSETGGVLPLEIKVSFRDDDSALSRDNYKLLSEYASIVVARPSRAIQVSIPEGATRSLEGRKLAARRLAIVEQVLRDTGVAERRIVPVLSQRSDDAFVLRVISNDQYDTMVEKKRDMFGDTTGTKKYKSMSW